MDVERTIGFMLKNRARFDARLEKNAVMAESRFKQAEKRLDRIERIVAQNNRIVGKLASIGVSLRSDVRRHEGMIADQAAAMARHEKMMARHEEVMSEIEDKLNGLIDIVARNHGKKNGKGN